jgi:hypothetical protein
VKLGQDPARDKAEAKAGAAETFKASADEFLEQQRTRLRTILSGRATAS